MRKALYRSYVLKGVELGLLLASSGAQTVCTVPFINGKETRADYLYAMEHMVKTGVIEPEGDTFIIKSPYDMLINYIIQSKKIILFRSADDEISDFCLHYVDSNKFLAVTPSLYKKDSVIITQLDLDAFINNYVSKELIPPESDECVEPDNEDLSEAVLEMLKQLKSGEEISDVRFKLGVYIVDPTTESEQGIIIANMPRGIFMMCFDEIGSRIESYTQEAFSKRLCEMNGGLKLI